MITPKQKLSRPSVSSVVPPPNYAAPPIYSHPPLSTGPAVASQIVQSHGRKSFHCGEGAAIQYRPAPPPYIFCLDPSSVVTRLLESLETHHWEFSSSPEYLTEHSMAEIRESEPPVPLANVIYTPTP